MMTVAAPRSIAGLVWFGWFGLVWLGLVWSGAVGVSEDGGALC